MDDLTRLKYLLSGKGRPDFSHYSNEIKNLFNTKDFTLRESQVSGLTAALFYRRIFCAMGVGEGKTILSFFSFLVTRSSRGLLMIPSNLVEKTILQDIPKIEKLTGIKLDYCCIQGKSQHARRALMNKHRITIFPYSYLSTEDTKDLLELSKADLIVFDESHSLKVEDSAKTERLLYYLDANPSIGLIFLSGTIMDKSIMDYWHLISRSLKHFSPLPLEKSKAQGIQDAISWELYGEFARSKFLCDLEPELKAPFGENLVYIDKARKFMKRLFDSSPCTVRTENQSVNCSLLINVIQVEMPKELDAVMYNIKEEWESPDGDTFEDILTLVSMLNQLSSGFYYRLYWPEDTPEHVLVEFERRKKLNSAIRHFISRRYRPEIDTPGLVEKALELDDPRVKNLKPEYVRWRESIYPEKVERVREIVWLSDYKIKAAVEWAKEKKNGIIWYDWVESGEALKKALPDATFCWAGCPVVLTENKGILICSIKSHGSGLNLQHHCENLWFDYPESGKEIEQLIGRTHRQGQTADCVNTDILVANPIDEAKLRKLYKQSGVLHTSNQYQKFIIADWRTDAYFNGDNEFTELLHDYELHKTEADSRISGSK